MSPLTVFVIVSKNRLRKAMSTTKLPYLKPKTDDQPQITRNQLYSRSLDTDDEDDSLLAEQNGANSSFEISSPDKTANVSSSPVVNDELNLDTIRKLAKETKDRETREKEAQSKPTPIVRSELKKGAEVIDDFIRNFLNRHNLHRTLDVFQSEWYEKEKSGELDASALEVVPDVYIQNLKAEEEIARLNQKLEEIMEKNSESFDKFESLRKEMLHHKRNHQRVVQEKKGLLKELNRLKNQCEKYDPVIDQLRIKYEKAMKEKMLIMLEKEKLTAKINALEATVQTLESDKPASKPNERQAKSASKPVSPPVNRLPTEDRPNPYMNITKPPVDMDAFSLSDAFEGHTMAIAGIALHPSKQILASVSDDATWKIWSVPSGKVIMSGDGHKDWVSGVAFSPKGTHLATSSGDATIKVWDFLNSCCSATLSDHSLAVWSVAYHDNGEFLVSSSMDQTARLWDLQTLKCRSTLRGHLDSVNHVTFVPFTNNVLTCSADKTVSLWDLRCDSNSVNMNTLFGHTGACNHVAIDLRAQTIASSDCEGTVIVWDMRTMTERTRLDTGPYPANKMAFDPSGTVLAVASDDGALKLYNFNTKEEDKMSRELKGHKDGVLDVVFDPEGKYIITSGSDAALCLWQ